MSRQGTLEHAETLVALRRYDEAVRLLSAAVAAQPHDATAWCLMAQAQLGAGAPAAALEAAKAAARVAPENEWPHRLASIALRDLDQPRQSLGAAREAVRLAPNEWQTLVTLSRALTDVPRGAKQAWQTASRAVEVAPLQPDAHLALGQAALARRRRRAAQQAFRRALELDPQNAPAHNELARARLTRAGFTPSALAAVAGGFAAAVRADPRQDVSRRNLELVMHVFLARTAYLVLLDALFVARFEAVNHGLVARSLPVLLLVLPVAFAWRFLAGLSAGLRRLTWEVTRRWKVLVPALLVAAAAVLVVVSALVPHSARPTAAGFAAVVAVLGRVALSSAAGKAAAGRRLSRRQALVSWGLLLLAAVLAGLTALFVVTAFVVEGDPGAVTFSAVVALACGVGFGLVVRAVRRQRAPAR